MSCKTNGVKIDGKGPGVLSCCLLGQCSWYFLFFPQPSKKQMLRSTEIIITIYLEPCNQHLEKHIQQTIVFKKGGGIVSLSCDVFFRSVRLKPDIVLLPKRFASFAKSSDLFLCNSSAALPWMFGRIGDQFCDRFPYKNPITWTIMKHTHTIFAWHIHTCKL